MNVIDAIRHHARMRPHDIAVVHPSGAASYSQLASVLAHLSVRMLSEGIKPGMTVAIYVSDPFIHLALTLGAMINGITSISAHPNYDPLPAHAKIDVFLVDRNLPFTPAGTVVPVGANWVSDGGRDAQAVLAGPGFADPEAVSRIFASSGTTGLAKLIGHSEAATKRMITRGLALDPMGRGPNLCMMWLSTIGGFGTALATLWHGSMLVLATAPLMVLRSINLYRVVGLRASPQQLQALVEMVRGRPVRFPSLEKIEVGGASTPSSVLLAARATLCPNIIGIYGSTEGGLVAQAPAAAMQAHPDAAGYVVPEAAVRIVDDSGNAVAVDVEGVIQVRTPDMTAGYIGDDEATQAAFRDGWFIPGDLGVMGADGLLRITGRADEMINAGGVKLSPVLVDEFLLSQPGVRDAAAFAFRQSGRSDQVWAAVVCSPDFDESALLAACRARLNSRAPTRLVRMSEIPRNAMGKPMRQKLSQDAARA
ncbi:MAG: long-chain fatty acid--CoA ligase [Ramlibacter sp.]|nr:long-chain fatty acid--CoA ligase [Ramlibacter sp.]